MCSPDSHECPLLLASGVCTILGHLGGTDTGRCGGLCGERLRGVDTGQPLPGPAKGVTNSIYLAALAKKEGELRLGTVVMAGMQGLSRPLHMWRLPRFPPSLHLHTSAREANLWSSVKFCCTYNNLVTVNREYGNANTFTLARLFLNLSLFMCMEPGQSQPLSSSQAQAFFGLPTSTLSERGYRLYNTSSVM